MRADINELTWRHMRQDSPLLIRFFTDWQLRICMDRLKLPCARLERVERATRRHCRKGMMVYPVKMGEE
jgi:hypothetical protein